MTTRKDVYEAIDKEREHQIQKYGKDKQQSLPGFLVILKRELDEAMLGWTDNETGRDAPLAEVVQVAAVAVACLEKYGVEGSAIATDDTPVPQSQIVCTPRYGLLPPVWRKSSEHNEGEVG
jgi:hypothetical protein